MKSPLTGKDPDAGNDWGQEVKGMTEDEMVRWHYWLNGHEFEQAPGGGEGQGKLVCCSPWGRKKSDTTEWPNNSKRDLTSRTIHHMDTLKMHVHYQVFPVLPSTIYSFSFQILILEKIWEHIFSSSRKYARSCFPWYSLSFHSLLLISGPWILRKVKLSVSYVLKQIKPDWYS